MSVSKTKKGDYEFQWGERISVLGAQFFADTYGFYFSKKQPQSIEYVAISENRYLENYASQKMLKEWKELSKMMLNTKK